MQRISVIDALHSVRHVTPDTWHASGWLARWLVASRAAVLVMTLSAGLLGGVLAALAGTVDMSGWLLCVVGLVLAHAANNQLNDLTDSARGIDTDNYFRNQYGAHPLEEGLLTRSQLVAMFVVTAGAALLIGLYLVARVGSAVWWPLLAGSFFLLAYTWPLKQWGMGELAVLAVWGPLMTGGTFLVASGHWSWSAAAIGTLYALAPTAVIFGKHIDKLEMDRDKQVFTLPVRLGERPARHVVIVMTGLQYAGLAALVLSGLLPATALLAMLAAPAAWRQLRVFGQPRPTAPPPDYPADAWPLWYAAVAFLHARLFGLLFLAGLALGLVISA